MTSTVQPVAAAAASVVPTYSQSPTYSTNAVTYSGEIQRCPVKLPSSGRCPDLSVPPAFGLLRNLVLGLRSGRVLCSLQLLPAAAAAEAGGGGRGGHGSLVRQPLRQEACFPEQTAATQTAAQTAPDPLLRRV